MKKIKWFLFIALFSVISATGWQQAKAQSNEVVEIFSGKIDQPRLKNLVLTGDIAYDRNCISVEDGLTQCDTGVKTEKYGTINFNYKHKMSEKACLFNGDKVLLKIKENGNAFVIR